MTIAIVVIVVIVLGLVALALALIQRRRRAGGVLANKGGGRRLPRGRGSKGTQAP